MKKIAFIVLLSSILLYYSNAEDGSKLWLRYVAIKNESIHKQYSNIFSAIAIYDNSIYAQTIKDELCIAVKSMLNINSNFVDKQVEPTLVIATFDWYDKLKQLKSNKKLLGDEGYILTYITLKSGKRTLVVAANNSKGLLYGTFDLLLRMQRNEDLSNIYVKNLPKVQFRVLNHWDNLNGSIERGYAGKSLWYGDTILNIQRLKDYARANASIGINTVVINNVNAPPAILSNDHIRFASQLADIFRPYGIRLMMSINFSSPKFLGGLPTSDPLNEQVRQWWKNKANEIYKLIPDFAGFLVKANSEGLPGPQDYGRTHAQGANMLAEALKPYGGIVVWRAFVYNPTLEDRAKQAYQEFVPLDGKFLNNVIIQVKNGPIDFQPREPFSPLFGALKKTAIALELQITQEYLGFSDHLVFLAPLYQEVLESETYAKGPKSSVAHVIEGSVYPQKYTLIAGVANTGNSVNWCGHHFAQANWFAYGRLAWNNQLTSEQIANEWLALTFNAHPVFFDSLRKIMLTSHEACVNYMTPLGLCHLMGYNHHHGPQPWLDTAIRADWNSVYYHRANSTGIGFDRTSKGSNAVAQYFSPLKEIFDNPITCPDKFILWFHHLPWNYIMKSGNTLWDELCYKYEEGVNAVKTFQSTWENMKPYVDEQRFYEVKEKLAIQLEEAIWWKEACLLYFQTFSQKPFPNTIVPPQKNLDYYKSIRSRYEGIH